MDLISACLCSHVDLRSRTPPEFRRIGAGLYFKLLNRLSRYGDSVLIDGLVVIIHAVQQEVVRLLADSVHRNRPALCLVLGTLYSLVHAGHQQIQLKKVAPV